MTIKSELENKLKSGIAFLFLAGVMAFVSIPAQRLIADDSSKWNNSQSFVGTVESVDGKAGRLTMKTWDNQEKQFRVGSKAALTLRSTDSKFADLKAGDQIIVTAEGNKVVSVALSTTDLKGSSGNNYPYRSDISSSDEEMKNKGVDPYRAASVSQPGPPAAQGLRDVPLSSSQPTGLIAAATSPQAPSGASSQPVEPVTPTPSPSAGASERTVEKVNGTVARVEPAANLITIKTPQGHLRAFTVDFNTKYNLSSAAGELADLKEDQPITITAQGQKALSVDTNTAAH